MALRGAQPVTIRPTGLSDAVDGSNVFAGAMAVLQDLIPNPSTRNQFVPRPASVQLTNFTGFTTPAQGEALLVVGNRAYGFIASARFAGKSEPFCYDLGLGSFVTIANVTNANTPTTQSNSGDWTPPQLAMIGTKLMMTHPGYDGVTHFVGWIDMRGFTSNTITGSTHGTTTIDTLSSNPITSGWNVGDAISDSAGDIPAGTYIVSLAASSVVISQAATGSHGGTTITVTSGTFAAPIYGSGQTNGVGLSAIPVDVANFNGRAWYAVGNGVQFSDAAQPLQITNATQALTLGDNTLVTALGGLPLSSQLVGGVIQAMIAFKAGSTYYQITGDQATNNLAVNAVAGSMGTVSANTVVSTPMGLMYVAQDGLRVIPPTGQTSQPIGQFGSGTNIPFVAAVNPTRMCAAYNHNVFRVSVQNGALNGQPVQEYWYDLGLQVWTGPHSFPSSLISAWDGPDDDFVLFASGINAKLWESDVWPDLGSTYTENGNAMSWTFQPTLSPDNSQVAMNTVIWALIGLALPDSNAINIVALDEGGNPLDTVSIQGNNPAASIWDNFNWGAAVWGSITPPYQQYQIDWHQPLVFKQMSIRVTGFSMGGFIIGNQHFLYKPEGYPTP